jgi:hypothetical protein
MGPSRLLKARSGGTELGEWHSRARSADDQAGSADDQAGSADDQAGSAASLSRHNT